MNFVRSNRVPTLQAIRQTFVWCLAALAIEPALTLLSEGKGELAAADFEREIAPLLVTRCVKCHNASEPSGELDLTTFSSVTTGGDSGPAVMPGKPESSLLLTRVRSREMPPKDEGTALSKVEIERLEAWVEKGASWPRGRVLDEFDVTTDLRAGRDWWSLKPIVRPQTPIGEDLNWSYPIDAFVRRRLDAENLTPSSPASRARIIRRAKFALLGIPPTPEEIQAFENDPSPLAYEKLVDRYLASPRYGERWARHWLDVVGFGESEGYEKNKLRPHAWPYRDYVIQSLNADKPYDRFSMEQIAGDQLGADVATSFLVGGGNDTVTTLVKEARLQQRYNDLDNMVATTGSTFLGLSLGCGRCHNHKFDPISQADYYRMLAVVRGVHHGNRSMLFNDGDGTQTSLRNEIARIDEALAKLNRRIDDLEEPRASVGKIKARRSAVNVFYNVERFAPVRARFVRFTITDTNEKAPVIDELEIYSSRDPERNLALASEKTKSVASDVNKDGKNPYQQTRHVQDGSYGVGFSWVGKESGKGWVQLRLRKPQEIDRVVWSSDRYGRKTDGLATEYKLEVALRPGKWQLVARSADRHPLQPGCAAKPQRSPDFLPEADAKHYRELVTRRQELEQQLNAVTQAQTLKEKTADEKKKTEEKNKGDKSKKGTGPQTPQAYAGVFHHRPPRTQRLHRGQVLDPREDIRPGSISGVGELFELDVDSPDGERRMGFARWLTSHKNPLTARVLVNRLWHYHFGRGLVETPSNFGFHGGKPSHPKLLDWLASELIDSGWSIKHMHRLIVLSATYQQSSVANPEAREIDSTSRFLWRFPPRRLEAEPIRDAVLAISGLLRLRMGGPGFSAFEPNLSHVKVYTPKTKFSDEDFRRMVYQTKPRMEKDATFGEFDCPDASGVAPQRAISTTALQALNLLNSPFMVEQAQRFAERVEAERPANVPAQVRHAFWLALGRTPESEELTDCVDLIQKHGLAVFCRVLFNANEFLYLN